MIQHNSQMTQLKVWSHEMFRMGREKGYSDEEICKWIRAYAKERNYSIPQINIALKHSGKSQRKLPNPLLVICPKCSKVGRLNSFHPTERPESTIYVVTHEAINGIWGKRYLKKHRRCYMRKPEHAQAILKDLHRSTEPVTEGVMITA